MQRGKREKINKQVWRLGWASFLSDFSGEMVKPILPMFLASLGGTGMIIGLVGGLRDSFASLLKVLSGYWADKLGKRKLFVGLGFLTSAFSVFFLAFSHFWTDILAWASLQRVGKGLKVAPRDAMVADAMPRTRGWAFGFFKALGETGAVLGSASVFFLFWYRGLSFHSIILLASFVAFLALLPLFWVKEKKRSPLERKLKIEWKEFSAPLKTFILVSSLFSLGNFSYMFFVLRAKEFFQGKLAIGAPLLLYIFFSVFYAAFAVPFGRLADRVGRRSVIILGYFLFSLTVFGFAFFHSFIAFMILFALYGTAYAMIDSNQRAYVADLSSPSLRATTLGTFHMTIGFASLFASLVAGALWQINPVLTFYFGAIMSSLALLLFVILRKDFQVSSKRKITERVKL